MSAGNSAVMPVPKLENDFYDWHQRHDQKLHECRSGNHDIIFIGDSITHLFEGDSALPGRGEAVWEKFYGSRNAMNLGFGWDRTQNVLWRIGHGEFHGQTPLLASVLIGTNNLTGTDNARANTPQETIAGIQEICMKIKIHSPATQILLMGLLPRSSQDDPLRRQIAQINSSLEAWVSGKSGFKFLDIGDGFLSPDRSIPKNLMDDAVHPTTEGYRIWAEAIEPIVAKAFSNRRLIN